MSSDDIYTLYNIDKSKLKRDYIKEPLKKIKINTPTGYMIEKPFKEDLEYLFIELNLTQQELYNYFNVKHSTFGNWMKFYNIKKGVKLRIKNTEKNNMKKYGVKWCNQLPEYFKNHLITNKKKYGVEYFSQSIEYKNKISNILNKQYKTKKKNRTFNTSKPEEEIYNLLCKKYKDIKRQYKSDLYPYRCDFYIPEIDTYIEYQGFFTHNNEPYDETNLIHQEKVKNFKLKHSKLYLKCLHTWTVEDPLKRETAKKNNLNWLEFFNLNQFMEWYNSQ